MYVSVSVVLGGARVGHALIHLRDAQKLLLPRSTLPYTGGTLVCGDNKWMYTAGPTGLDNPAGVLQCVAGVYIPVPAPLHTCVPCRGHGCGRGVRGIGFGFFWTVKY